MSGSLSPFWVIRFGQGSLGRGGGTCLPLPAQDPPVSRVFAVCSSALPGCSWPVCLGLGGRPGSTAVSSAPMWCPRRVDTAS